MANTNIISNKKRKNAHYYWYENLTICFNNSPLSKKITAKISETFTQEIKPLMNWIDFSNLKTETNRKTIDQYLLGQISYVYNYFVNKIVIPDKTKLPIFLIRKYRKLIKKGLLNKASEYLTTINWNWKSNDKYFWMSLYEEFKACPENFTCIFNDIKYYELIVFSNITAFQEDNETLKAFVRHFKYIYDILNMKKYMGKAKEPYFINTLINDIYTKYLKWSEKEINVHRGMVAKSITSDNSFNKRTAMSLVLVYTLMFNWLLIDNYNKISLQTYLKHSFNSRWATIVNNTMQNFNEFCDTAQLSNYIKSTWINDILGKTSNNNNNRYYNVEQIKHILTNSEKVAILQRSNEYFKNWLTEQNVGAWSKMFEQMDDNQKTKNIRTISFCPRNPKVLSAKCVILISGFLSENENHEEEWENWMLSFNNSDIVYFYNWPGESTSSTIGSTWVQVGGIIAKSLIGIGSSELGKMRPEKVFTESSDKAKISGKLLGIMLASRLFLPYHTVTLVGFSLGTHVIKHCIKEMYLLNKYSNVNCTGIIEKVILMGSATSIKGKEGKYKDIFNTIVSEKVVNCFSKNDEVLNILYKTAVKKEPIGNSNLDLDGLSKVVNCDCSNLKLGHLDYRDKMDLIMNKIAIVEK